MSSAGPEYAIKLAVVGVLAAVGIPAWNRGQTIVGGACIGVAVSVGVWVALEWLQRMR